jgi:hypothetical protein
MKKAYNFPKLGEGRKIQLSPATRNGIVSCILTWLSSLKTVHEAIYTPFIKKVNTEEEENFPSCKESKEPKKNSITHGFYG